ncbi:hypothetical protein [Paludibacter sp. 221]|uniref:hypothetical protein n=1 Tax=Paludibacter sp. 221 TaxID=2302939 RepID=UPI0013D81989|nr:hypothetical protein [Paludibacter sp. 221]
MAKKEDIVKLEEKVEVYGTGKSSFMEKGKIYKVHPIHAETLVKSGRASKTEVK